MRQSTLKPIEGAVWLPHISVRPNPSQPRKFFDAEELENLRQSIREHGMQQPIRVRNEPSLYDGSPFVIVMGERRWRAAQGVLDLIPCIIADVDAKEAAVLALVENIQRHDLTELEQARGLIDLMESEGLSQLAAARRLNKHPNWVRNRFDLVKTAEDVQAVAAVTPSAMSSLLLIDGVRDDSELRASLLEQVRAGAAHAQIKARVETHQADVQRTRDANRIPDAETQARLAEQSRSGGGQMSRGRLVKGTPKDEVRAAIEEALLQLEGQATTLKNWAMRADAATRRDFIEPRLARLRRQLREIGAGEG